MQRPKDQRRFREVVKFHGCYCLDIAMGYRVASALMREMAGHMDNMKDVVGYVGAPACAVDAMQHLTGCTLGKRNLVLTGSGKHVFVLHNTSSGKAVRAYVHYWDNFDHSELRAAKQVVRDGGDRAELEALVDSKIQEILQAPEQVLFQLSEVQLSQPPKSGKFQSAPCSRCGEYAKEDWMVEQGGERLCRECAPAG